MKERIVCVEWEDASYNSGYYDKKDTDTFNPVLTRTTGHLVSNTRKSIILSQDRFYDSKGNVTDERHISTIPKKMVRRVIYLAER